MSNVLAFLTGMGGGYMQGRERARRQAREDEETAYVKMRRAREQQEWDRQDALRKDVTSAATPRAVEDGTVYQPANDDEGNVMPANPTAGTFKADGQRFASMADAQQAATAANTPQAAAARMSSAYMRHGEADKAASVRASARQEELAGIQLDRTKKASKREDALMEFGHAVARGDWAGLPAVYERYNDGNTVQVQQDGRGGATVTQISKDGKPIASKTYASLPEFMTDAYAAFDPEKWLGLQREDARNKKADERDTRDFGLRKQVAEASMANDATRTRLAAAAEGRASKAAADDAKIPPAVKMMAASATKRLETIGKSITDAMAQGAWDAKSAGAQQLLTEQRTIQAQLDNLLAPYVEAAQAGKGGKKAANADPLGLMSGPPAGAAAVAPAASAAGASATAGVPARPPAGPSMMDRAASVVGDMRAGGAEYQAIYQRVREAGSGGAPLTPDELIVARRWGLPV